MKNKKDEKLLNSILETQFKAMTYLNKKHPKELPYAEYVMFVTLGRKIKLAYGAKILNMYVKEIKGK